MINISEAVESAEAVHFVFSRMQLWFSFNWKKAKHNYNSRNMHQKCTVPVLNLKKKKKSLLENPKDSYIIIFWLISSISYAKKCLKKNEKLDEK